VVLAGCGAAAAQSASHTGFVSGNANGCKIWAPPQLSTSDFVPRYTGGCKDGKAEGRGKLQWLYRYAGLKVKSSWDGYFRQGVFVGAKPFTHSILPEQDTNEYIVGLGGSPDGHVLAFAENDSHGVMDLCAAGILGISVDAKVPTTDNAAVKQAMAAAGAKLKAVCPQTAQSVQVNVYSTPFGIDAAGQRTVAFADGRLDMQSHAVTSYSNEASNVAEANARLVAMQAGMAKAKQTFTDFSKRNHITAWVTVAQLDENPFRYQGKVVGVVVGLERMVTPHTALVGGALEGDGAALQLHGLTPAFPGPSHGVLVAAKVGKRGPLPGQSENSGIFTSLTRIDSLTCADPECYSMLSWARGAARIDWGAPYVAK
jgi:hypothetical protein